MNMRKEGIQTRQRKSNPPNSGKASRGPKFSTKKEMKAIDSNDENNTFLKNGANQMTSLVASITSASNSYAHMESSLPNNPFENLSFPLNLPGQFPLVGESLKSDEKSEQAKQPTTFESLHNCITAAGLNSEMSAYQAPFLFWHPQPILPPIPKGQLGQCSSLSESLRSPELKPSTNQSSSLNTD